MATYVYPRFCFSAFLCVAILILGTCDSRGPSKINPRPPELVGRWVRDVPDLNSGDTIELRSDGSIVGVVRGKPQPAQWIVKQGPAALLMFCASASDGSSCRTYTISGDRLVLDGGPTGKTVFHRLP